MRWEAVTDIYGPTKQIQDFIYPKPKSLYALNHITPNMCACVNEDSYILQVMFGGESRQLMQNGYHCDIFVFATYCI